MSVMSELANSCEDGVSGFLRRRMHAWLGYLCQGLTGMYERL